MKFNSSVGSAATFSSRSKVKTFRIDVNGYY